MPPSIQRFTLRADRGQRSLVLVCLSIVAYLPASPARGATLSVCAACTYTTIQSAIGAASAGDVIRILDPIHTEANVSIGKDVTIEGLGMDTTVVRAHEFAFFESGRIFTVANGVRAVLRKMALRNGDHAQNGGAVHNGGLELLLDEVRVAANRAPEGGGIYNASGSALHLRRSEVLVNRAEHESATEGGGIFNMGSLLVEESLVDDNRVTGIFDPPVYARGGGIANHGTATVVKSSVSFNELSEASLVNGAGIYSVGPLYISRSVIEGNSLTHGNGGGIASIASLVIADSHVVGNSAFRGGGIYVPFQGSIRILRGAIYDNAVVENGGGLYSISSDVRLANVTISGNRADLNGGGIFVHQQGFVRAANTTIAQNRADADNDNSGAGGGIYVAALDPGPIGDLAFINSLVVNNVAASSIVLSSPDCFGTLISDGYNIVGALGCVGLGCPETACNLVGSQNGVQTEIVVPLDPLALYGGLTPSHRPPSGSPAIDAGNPSACLDYDGSALEVDQRFAHRIGICDVGSHERDGVPAIFFDGFESGSTVAWSAL